MKLKPTFAALAILACAGLSAALTFAENLSFDDAEHRIRQTLEKIQLPGNPVVGDVRKQPELPELEGVKHKVPEFFDYGQDQMMSVDPLVVAQKFEQKNKLYDINEDEKADLLVFVSFSMPDASLKRIAAESKRAGAAMVLRGFKNQSLKATMQAVEELVALGGKVLIHPELFALYDVIEVPTTVLAKKDSNMGTCGPESNQCTSHYNLKGDVSLHYVLEQFSEFKSNPELDSYAETKLAVLKGYK